jgi:DNA-binding PadR family transcriptional regulator
MPEAHSPESTSVAARDLTAFQRNILVILAERPMYGLAVKRELEAYYGSEVNHGRLYPNLDDLVGMAFIEKSELDKRTNQYELTDEGRAVVLDSLEWTLSRFVTDGDRARTVRDLVDEQL